MGKISKSSYFQLSVTNNTDSAYIIFRGLDLTADCTFSEIEFELENGKRDTLKILGGDPVGFGIGASKIFKPYETSVARMSLFYRDTEGVIPENKEFVSKIKRVRLNIRKYIKYN